MTLAFSPPAELRFRPDDLRRFIRDAFLTTGLSGADADTCTDVLATADEFGVSTHGTKLLHAYLSRLNGGGTPPDATPETIREGPAWALVNGHDAIGMVTGMHCMRSAIAKARSAGIAFAGARRSSHFGPAGYYALAAARAGLIGIAVANDVPTVVAPGAKRAVVGTNPFAFAIPAGRHDPILLDVAISTVAGGKVYASRMLNRPIPDDWIVGEDGLPTTDASLYPEKAALMPAAGHKGYGLALLIEALSGLLTGAAVTSGIGSWLFIPPTEPSHHGAAFIAINPAMFGSDEVFRTRVDALIDEIRATPAVEGRRVMVPGELEFARQRQAQTQPLVLAPDVTANARKAADIAGLNLDDYVAR